MATEQKLLRLTLKRNGAATSSDLVMVKIEAQMNTHHDFLQMEFVRDGFNNNTVLQFVHFTFTRNSVASVIFSRSLPFYSCESPLSSVRNCFIAGERTLFFL